VAIELRGAFGQELFNEAVVLVKYIVFIQDNDADGTLGESSFSNIALGVGARTGLVVSVVIVTPLFGSTEVGKAQVFVVFQTF
jgi:hypothetical protein